MSDELKFSIVKVVGDHALDFASLVYHRILVQLLPQLEDASNVNRHFLPVPFALTCAACLEAMLNDHLVAFCFDYYPTESYLSIAEGYTSMSLRGKLDVLVPSLTTGNYVIKRSSRHYQDLLRLIRLRNELVHPKSFFVKGTFPPDTAEDHAEEVPQSDFDKKMYSKAVRSVSPTDCRRFFDALQALEKLVLGPVDSGKVRGNALIGRAG
jgi:hypothetical protein